MSIVNTLKLSLFISAATCIAVMAKDVVITKDPVQILAPVDNEIRIEFPETIINLNIKEPANSALETLLKTDGTLYWKANYDFEESRALATTASGEVIILDVKSVEPSSEKVVYRLTHQSSVKAVRPPGTTQPTKATAKKQVPPKKKTVANKQQPSVANLPNQDPYVLMPAFLKKRYQTDNQSKPKKQYSYTDMAAFAMQHYMGPARLICSGIIISDTK